MRQEGHLTLFQAQARPPLRATFLPFPGKSSSTLEQPSPTRAIPSCSLGYPTNQLLHSCITIISLSSGLSLSLPHPSPSQPQNLRNWLPSPQAHSLTVEAKTHVWSPSHCLRRLFDSVTVCSDWNLSLLVHKPPPDSSLKLLLIHISMTLLLHVFISTFVSSQSVQPKKIVSLCDIGSA